MHLIEQPPTEIVLLEQMAKAAHCRLIRNRLAAQIDFALSPIGRIEQRRRG
jgi:hypothetical protein